MGTSVGESFFSFLISFRFERAFGASGSSSGSAARFFLLFFFSFFSFGSTGSNYARSGRMLRVWKIKELSYCLPFEDYFIFLSRSDPCCGRDE